MEKRENKLAIAFSLDYISINCKIITSNKIIKNWKKIMKILSSSKNKENTNKD